MVIVNLIRKTVHRMYLAYVQRFKNTLHSNDTRMLFCDRYKATDRIWWYNHIRYTTMDKYDNNENFDLIW